LWPEKLCKLIHCLNSVFWERNEITNEGKKKLKDEDTKETIFRSVAAGFCLD
jgi:hypothetical protein